MAFRSSTVTLGTSATLISPVGGETDNVAGLSVAVNNTSSVTIYIGGPGVTTANGWPMLTGDKFAAGAMGEGLYGVVASGTAVINVIEESV